MPKLANLILVLAFAATGICAAADAGGTVYPEVAPNVTFADVIALDFTPETAQISYGDANPALQRGWLWLPPAATSRWAANTTWPLIVFIHGGCWLNAYDIRHTLAFASALAQSGYAVWSLEYRRTGDAGGGWPGTFADVMAGIAGRLQLTDSPLGFPIDTANYVIMGHSAGGHLALLAGSKLAEARAVVGLAAITDIDAYARGSNSCQTATPAFMGSDPDAAPGFYAVANPVAQQLHNNTYLLQGAADEIVPPPVMPVAGTRTVTATAAGHFDWVHPGTPAYGQLLQLLADIFSP